MYKTFIDVRFPGGLIIIFVNQPWPWLRVSVSVKNKLDQSTLSDTSQLLVHISLDRSICRYQLFFKIYMSIIWIYVMGGVRPAGQPSLVATTLILDIKRKLFNHFPPIPAMFMGTIDSYRLQPISLTLTLPGVTRSARSKTHWLHFLAHFSSDQDVVMKQYKLKILRRFIETRGTTAALLTA